MSPRRHLPMPELAYRNPNFMESLPGRPLRILAEYLDPLHVHEARKGGGHDRNASVPRDWQLRGRPRWRISTNWKRRFRCARRVPTRSAWRCAPRKSRLAMSRYYEEARELAHRLTHWSMTLGKEPRRFVVCSGGGPGIMEAANRGAAEAGGPSMGLSIQLPHERVPQLLHFSPELNFCFHYFFMRKLWFAQMAKGR